MSAGFACSGLVFFNAGFVCKRKIIENKFYKNLCEIIFETLKIQYITKEELSEKINITDSYLAVEEYLNKKQSVIIVMGHQGNWELIGAAFSAKIPQIIKSVYYPQNNGKINHWLLKLRSKFGNEMYSSKDVLRKMISNKNIGFPFFYHFCSFNMNWLKYDHKEKFCPKPIYFPTVFLTSWNPDANKKQGEKQ